MNVISNRLTSGLTLLLLVACLVLAFQLRAALDRAERAEEINRALAAGQLRQERLQSSTPSPLAASQREHRSQASGRTAAPPSTAASASAPSMQIPTAGPATTQEFVDAQARLNIKQLYVSILPKLLLSSQQEADLIALLASEAAAATSTPHSAGVRPDPQERQLKLAAIVGATKLQEFETLESKLAQYGLAHQMQAQLTAAGVPMSADQQAKMVEVLVSERERSASAEANGSTGALDDLERALQSKEEFDRHVLEDAAVLLSPKQLEHLQELYRVRSAQRAMAIDLHRRAAQDGSAQGLPLWYPVDEMRP